MTLYMMKGLPACGKSTRARELRAELGNCKIVNKDLLRTMLDDGKYSGSNEKFILKARDLLVEAALDAKQDVIVDDTNLDERHPARLSQIANFKSAKFEVIDMTGVDVETCLERDSKRPNYVGSAVILKFWHQYLKPAPRVDPNDLPKCVICDIDGTLADLNGRDPYDASTCCDDLPRAHVVTALNALASACRGRIIFVSGRPDDNLEMTREWLKKHVYEFSSDSRLYMRKSGDSRKDTIVKREIFEEFIDPNYRVMAVIDDRPCVIRMWQSLGFSDRIFNVGDGREF